ncbi:MAG: FRG domain-containing protein [Candidatus Thiodiazotropha taylori]|nr:FRG domain-containing protein [Candidatus Thiodiazotropha taylori]
MQHVAKLLAKINYGDNIIYRGHAKSEWELKPSIGRHYTRNWKNVLAHEKKSLDEFKKRSIPHLKYKPTTDIEWLCLMQHHGCSTRLLDFTTNPLIALFFASEPIQRIDGAVIIAKYGRTYENVSDENLFERSHNFAYHPPHITERIIGQSGCFVYSAAPNKQLKGKQIETIQIPWQDKYLIRRELKHIGIHFATLFPGMDGVCKDLNESLVNELLIEEMPF